MLSFPSSDNNSAAIENSKKLRVALRDRYISLCDQRNVEPSRKVLTWISNGVIDEPNISGADAGLSVSKKINPTTGTLIDADPFDCVIEIFRLIPLAHVSLDGASLHNSQVRKLLQSLLSGTSRSTWTLSSLILYGNQVDASVFPDLLLVMERFPLLTVVRVDPAPHCHLAQLDQLCAANEAKCRHSFVQRKRGEVSINAAVSASSSINSADGSAAYLTSISKAITPNAQLIPIAITFPKGSSPTSPHRTVVETTSPASSFRSSVTSVPAILTCGAASHVQFPISVSSFIGSIKSWVYFFYPPGKDLPDSMFYFLVKHIITALQDPGTNSSGVLLESLKQVEREFVNWRGGVFRFSDAADHDVISAVSTETNRCVHCDRILDFTQSVAGQSKKLFDTLLMESEVGSKCFVQDNSTYVANLFIHLMSRFSKSPSSIASVSTDDASLQFTAPPQFCSPSCTKRFCRSMFCAASGLDHAVEPISFLAGVPVARQFPGVVEFDTLLQAASSTSPSGVADVLLSSRENPVHLYRPYVDQRGDVTSSSSSSKIAVANHGSNVMNISTTSALRDVVNRHVPQARLQEAQLLASDPFYTFHNRFPTKGLSLGDLFSHSRRRGLPMGPLPLTNSPTAQHTPPLTSVHMTHSLAVKFSWSNNSPSAPTPFELIQDYFLSRKKQFNGSSIALGLKLRPAVFFEILNSSRSNDGTPILVSENEDGQSKFGVPVALHVIGVELLGNVWYVIAEYHGRILYLDEPSVNKGASRYGAFAFVEPTFDVWLLAVQSSDPHSPLLDSSSIKSLEPLERRIEMELALMLMSHLDVFYPSTAAYAHRSSFTLPRSLVKHVDYIRQLLSDMKFSPADHSVSDETLRNIISWYRDGNLGRLASYWENEAPASFYAFALRCCRHVFAHPKLAVHPCLQPFVAGTALTQQIDESSTSSSSKDVWLIPQTNCQRIFTSGMFQSPPDVALHPAASSREEENSIYHNILSEFGVLDLSYVQHASSTASLVGAGHKRYVTIELTQRASRMTQLALTFVKPSRPASSETESRDRNNKFPKVAQDNDQSQSGLRITVSYSDDGKLFQRCGGAPFIRCTSTPPHDDSPEHLIKWRNVGAHRWWCVAVDPVNHVGELLHDIASTSNDHNTTSVCIPSIKRISWKYKPDSLTPLLIDYSQDHMLLVHAGNHGVALVIDRPYLTTSTTPSTSVLPFTLPRQKPAWTTDVFGAGTGGGYLASATSQLCGIPEKSIAFGMRLYCFRGEDVVAIDKFSGQVISSASSVKVDSLCSHFPLMFQEQLLGGFECFASHGQRQALLFLYNATHYGLFSPASCTIVQPPSPWIKLPGRSLIDIDAFGVPTNVQLVRDGVDPYEGLAFPFSEVDVCFPIGPKSLTHGKEVFAVCFGSQYIRWELHDTRCSNDQGGSQTEVKSIDHQAGGHVNAQSSSVRQLSDSLPMMISSRKTNAVVKNSLTKSQRSDLFRLAYQVIPTSVVVCRRQNAPSASTDIIKDARLERLISGDAASRPTPSNVDPTTAEARSIHFIHIHLESPESIYGIALAANDGGSTFTLVSRQETCDPWNTIASASQGEDGVALLWVDGVQSFSSELGVRVDGPGLTTDIQQLSIFGVRLGDQGDASLDHNSNAEITPFLEVDIGVHLKLQPSSSQQTRQEIDCVRVCSPLSTAPQNRNPNPVIAGVVLRWIDLFSKGEDGVDNAAVTIAAPIFIQVTTEFDQGNHVVLVESFKVSVSDLICTIPFPPRPIGKLFIARLHSEDKCPESILSAKCYLLQVQLRCERVQMISKAALEDQKMDDPLPIHLRIDPSEFAQQILQRQMLQSQPRDNIPAILTSSTCHTLARSGAEYHLTLSQHSTDSDAKLLARMSTVVSDSSESAVSKHSLKGERAVLSYRDLTNEWVVCTESYVSESLILDFVWDNVPMNPPPFHWKVQFVHSRASVRWFDLHFLTSTTISSADGFERTSLWSRLASTSPYHHSINSCANLSYNGPPQRISHVSLSIPPTAPFIGGVHIELDPSQPTSETVVITAYDAKRGEQVQLWSGTPLSTELFAKWAPTRCSEVSIFNLRSSIGRCKMLLPSSSLSLASKSIRDASWSLHHGLSDVPISSFPAVIPLAVGAALTLTGSTSHPLILSSMRVKSSEPKLQFQISYLSTEKNSFVPVGWVETVANQWAHARISAFVGLPTQWRLTCCACGSRSQTLATELAYVSLDVDPVFCTSVQLSTPVDLSEASCTFLTNAIARHNATSQATLRQRFLSKVHSTDATPLQPYLRFGNFDNAAGGANDDWEKRSQVSSSSGAGMSSAPFIFVALDLRTQPRAFSAIEINAQTDTQFELEIQWSNDNSTFHTAAVHQQGNGRWNSNWENQGAHAFWRVVVSFAQLAGRSKKKSQASNIGTDIDEKLLAPFLRAVSLCAVERIVWSEVDTSATLNNSVAISGDELVAIRRHQVADPRVLLGLNPLRRVSIPLGLQIPTRARADSLLLDADVHPQDFDARSVGALSPSIFALWRTAVAKPSQSMNRVAIAAEDELQSTLPQIMNPQNVLDKESAAHISKIFFGGADFELTGASLLRQMNRVTAEPSVVINGTSVAGVRGIPPGTRLALCFEWSNNSLIPSQPQLSVRSMMIMDRNWLSVQSEFASIDSFCRVFPSIRDTVFSDLCSYTVVYVVSKDDIHVGGHYPPLVGLDSHDSFEALLSQGVNVVASNVKSSALVQLFRGIRGPAQSVSSFVEAQIGNSDCTVTLHSNFDTGSVVRLVISIHHADRVDSEGLLQLKALSIVVSWNGQNNFTVECVGNVHIPRWTNDVPFSIHSVLYEGEFSAPDGAVSKHGNQTYIMALACSDEQYLSRSFLGQHTSIGLRSIVGIAHVTLVVGQTSSPPHLVLDNLCFHANLRFTSMLQLPCVLWPQRNDSSSIVLQTSSVSISRLCLSDFISVEFEKAGFSANGSNSGLPKGFGDFVGSCRAVFSPKVSTGVLELFGTASWRGTPKLPSILSFDTSNESPLLRVQISVPPQLQCSWHDDILLDASHGRLEFSISRFKNCQDVCIVTGFFASSGSSVPNSFNVTAFSASSSDSIARIIVNVDVSIGKKIVPLRGVSSSNIANVMRWSPQQLAILKDIITDSVTQRLSQHLVGLDYIVPFFETSRIRWHCRGRLCGTPFAISICCDSQTDVVDTICASILWHTALKTISLSVQRTS
ncbi:Hypothetical protein, putative [Bodo saltans]|uniref:Uncharacterized protein n=1 Tax=Bodo saltans TaxID=75058 RepID=A0A0S4IUI5_BODSA|nr:Hypothetical protein, putative [Bodo saltans]|eukprot:CUG11265.1 Hypothetical protein, putative [Bodo saltans]